MPHRAIFAAVPVAVFLIFVAAQFVRADNTHSGKVVSVTEGTGGADGKLVMTDDNGKNEHNHAISSSTKITRDGKTVALRDLKKGDTIKVTTAEGGKVTQVAATAGDSKSGAPSRQAKPSDRDQGKLPEEFDKLNLSAQQKDKIEGIIRDYDAKLQSAWEEFGERYQDAISLEATMLAAMEEHLSENQKSRVHEHRGKAAKGEAQNEDGNSRNANDPSKQPGQAAGAKTGAANANPNQQKAANPAEEEIVIIGISLSPEQQTEADKIHRTYFGRLRDIGQDLGRLHARLVALETEKIVKIEKELTKDQLAQLRKMDEQSQSGTATTEKEGATKK